MHSDKGIVFGNVRNKSGQQSYDALDCPLKYVDRYIEGAIADSVLRETVVAKPCIGDSEIRLLHWLHGQEGELDDDRRGDRRNRVTCNIKYRNRTPQPCCAGAPAQGLGTFAHCAKILRAPSGGPDKRMDQVCRIPMPRPLPRIVCGSIG